MLAGHDVLIPCKVLAHGKSRLASVLPPAERVKLCAGMLQRTVDTVTELVRPENVWLVTSDAAAAVHVRQSKINVVADDGGGLNAALEAARRGILRRDGRRTRALIVLPIDLPLIDAAALDHVITGGVDVSIGSDRAGSGTNVLCLTGAAAMGLRFSYGEGSFQRHCSSALQLGYRLRIVKHAALAFDLDEPHDLHDLSLMLPYRASASTHLRI
jgi:2-phospho-L-lactate guanylyltransferase